MAMQKQWSMCVLAICGFLAIPTCLGYMATPMKESYFSDALLREIVDRMGKDLSDAADSYIDPMPLNEMPSARLSLMSRAGNKVLEAEQMDYDSLLDGNPNPALRDQEFAQHSSLWGHHFVSGGHGEGGDSMPAGFGRMPQIKTDASLPAYCNPPNPCPVGFTEEQGCLMDFENTAGFSRDYQAAQECMCDGEHMFDCQQESKRQLVNSDLEQYLAQKFGSTEHKNLVAKKFQPNKNLNPYLQGEKLPVAAKKGNMAF